MRAGKRQPVLDEDFAGDVTQDVDGGAEDDVTEAFGDGDEEIYGIFRVQCPECGRPIALLADEEVLPEHALCPTPWNPFGLTVCAGSGSAVEDAAPVDDDGADEQDVASLLTLPEGLDWRTQPFSHANRPRR
ncbi:hypothetical protein [Streptomyces silvisoli]|uniref:Uncharacterized protein n=1 Tax=Streptomyces silvisoli TaxID=3034235 RepID=A0ABT5ZG45_9ACTN|nr:hypothetical protein [Streptomyces silvisoli]MDF3288799.1 hypothetical protein [Streptomyces silvisoli]